MYITMRMSHKTLLQSTYTRNQDTQLMLYIMSTVGINQTTTQ